MVTVGIFRFKENSHGRAGNRTRDLTISSQRLWPLDHEAGLKEANVILNISFLHWCFPAAVYTDMKAISVNVRRKPLLLISKIDTKQGFVLAKANTAQGRYICMPTAQPRLQLSWSGCWKGFKNSLPFVRSPVITVFKTGPLWTQL